LRLTVDEIDGYTGGTYLVEVPPAPSPKINPTWILGREAATPIEPQMWWGSEESAMGSQSVVIECLPVTFTAQQAADAWGGHLVAFTVEIRGDVGDLWSVVSAIEVVR
jgi:hypothetical protein